MRRVLTVRLARQFAFAVLAAGALSPVHAQVVLTVSSWVPPTNHLTQVLRDWCGQLESRTSGAARCNILPRAVSSPPGTFDAVANGAADVSFTVQGYTPGRFVLSQMAELPFLGNTSEGVSLAFQQIHSKYAPFRDEYKGVHVLSVFTHGPGVVYNTKRRIARPEDLAGLKFRIGGGLVTEVAAAMGMNVTLKPATESYELLSTGIMDGTLMAAESVAAFKLDKLVRHATFFEGGFYNTAFVFLMNRSKYESLPPEVRKVVDELSGAHAARMFGRAWDAADRTGKAVMQAAGVEITRADAAFTAAVKGRVGAVEEKWIANARARGLADPQKVLKEFRDAIAALER